ncbi:MAG TPA: hypothetical protein VFJ82_12670 [Longimicrobium sp.]|nr:hypothetical protein [Longimicrobium sp.]
MASTRFRRARPAVGLLFVLTTGCYHYYVAAPHFDPADEWHSRTLNSYAWGLVNKPQMALAQECEDSNALDQVRVTRTLGTTLATVLTLGIWSPLRVEYKCAKRKQAPGSISAIPVEPTEGA